MPLALWGGYTPGAALCQRIIGRAAARCGTAVWAARAACLKAQVAGGTCNQPATDAAVQQAHQDALDIVDRYCADYAQDLGFSLTLETQADIDTFCQQLDGALVSSVYGPLLVDGTVPQVDANAAGCSSALADAAGHLLRLAFRSRARALDRIASGALTPSEKVQAVERSTAHIQRGLTVVEHLLQQRCPDERFVALYRRSASEVLTLIEQRGDCLGGAAYVQNAVLCPPAVCGNGMMEPGEQCDDGNTLSGDDCVGTCIREITPQP
jgi:cysteine-rich repeat protein